MKNLFSIGEVSKYQNISKQTLIFYDKIGLFRPAYIDPDNGYRYYSANQIDYLDTILIMKKIGFSLSEIKEHMESYTLETSLTALKGQLTEIDRQLQELALIKSRVVHKCTLLEQSMGLKSGENPIKTEFVQEQYLYCEEVEFPYSPREVSIATKKCFAEGFKENLPIFLQCGVIVPYDRILKGEFEKASHAFLPIEKTDKTKKIIKMPEGKCVSLYHLGDYMSMGESYERLLSYCKENNSDIISDSYEFCINDYITSRYENEYITKIIFYVK